MTYRIAICEVCLKEFKVQAKGQIPHQCSNCSTDKKKPINDFVTIIPLNHPDMKANQERSDCKHRINKCLKKYADQEYLPCRTCENYEPKKDEPVIFAYHGQNDWLD
jgi:hypothetical protein